MIQMNPTKTAREMKESSAGWLRAIRKVITVQLLERSKMIG
jgi:hypothetical protein